jgi:hypothetical protein
VGFYLLAEGTGLLRERVVSILRLASALRIFLLEHPDEFYLPGIAALTLAIVWGVLSVDAAKHLSVVWSCLPFWLCYCRVRRVPSRS